MKRFLAAFLMLAILLTGLTVTANAAGWEKDDNGWRFSTADGKYLSDAWKMTGGFWYYLKPDTYMAANEICDYKDNWYAFDSTGAMYDNRWVSFNWDGTTYWYYAGKGGALRTGWLDYAGKWYYLWPVMETNGAIWTTDAPHKVYYFNAKGEMVTDCWQWCDVDGHSGWFYFGSDGAAYKGWLEKDGVWYYLDPEYGQMLSNGIFQLYDKNFYCFNAKGQMLTGWQKSSDGYWYFFMPNGAAKKAGWLAFGGKWYWLKEDGKMAAGETVNIAGKDYSFDANGAWIEPKK